MDLNGLVCIHLVFLLGECCSTRLLSFSIADLHDIWQELAHLIVKVHHLQQGQD